MSRVRVCKRCNVSGKVRTYLTPLVFDDPKRAYFESTCQKCNGFGFIYEDRSGLNYKGHFCL